MLASSISIIMHGWHDDKRRGINRQFEIALNLFVPEH